MVETCSLKRSAENFRRSIDKKWLSKVTNALISAATACAKAIASLFSSLGIISSPTNRRANESAIACCVEVKSMGAHPGVLPIIRIASPAPESPFENAYDNSARHSGGTNKSAFPSFARSAIVETASCPSAMAKRIFVSTARCGAGCFTVNHLHRYIEMTFIFFWRHFRGFSPHFACSRHSFRDL
jgi:hypothetical protein